MKKAKVDGVEVGEDAVRYELERLLKFYGDNGMKPAELKCNMETLRGKALEQAIGAALIRKRAESLDIETTGAEIDAAFDKTAAQAGGRERLVAILAKNGVSEEAFRASLARGIRMDKVVEQACSGVPEPTEDEIAAFYAAHKDEYAADPQVFCRHILVKGDGAGGSAAALDKIRRIREDIASGREDFAEQAKLHSDCPSGREGGSLGWFSPGMMVPEFDKAAFSMAKGEVSEPVETQFGWHIIYKEDERPGGPRELAQVHDMIKELLRHNARGRAVDAFVAELRKDAKIEYYDD